jgi:hypothetical protein
MSNEIPKCCYNCDDYGECSGVNCGKEYPCTDDTTDCSIKKCKYFNPFQPQIKVKTINEWAIYKAIKL